MRVRVFAAAFAAALTGCATTPAPVTVQRVQVPVVVPCIAEVPARPALIAAETYRATADEFQRARALVVDRLRLLEHSAALEEILRACMAGVQTRGIK